MIAVRTETRRSSKTDLVEKGSLNEFPLHQDVLPLVSDFQFDVQRKHSRTSHASLDLVEIRRWGKYQTCGPDARTASIRRKNARGSHRKSGSEQCSKRRCNC